MPIQNYSVLKGKPTSAKVVTGKSTHYQVTVQATGGPFTVAVNIQSSDGSDVLYAINHAFVPPSITGLAALPSGMNKLSSKPAGLALDFVREQVGGHPMIALANMTLLPQRLSAHHAHKSKAEHEDVQNIRAKALGNAVESLIMQAIAEGDATIYAFGSSYADAGRVDGIHDIHMNQGNPSPGSHAKDNGSWQDGAVFLDMPKLAHPWSAIFLAFQTESWKTDNNGNPA